MGGGERQRAMQPKKMLIEQDPQQTRVAVLESDRVVEVYYEPREGGGLAGSVFKGRVHRVLPGMQAAFLDVGLERDAFLHVEDVRPRSVNEDSEVSSGDAAEDLPTIEDLLKPGQEVIVQVVKGPLANKGARVTSHVTLPGRHLVYIPGGDHRGVSRRIEDEVERERLRSLLDEIETEGGFIARTAGQGCDLSELQADATSLAETWQRIQRKAESAGAGDLLHRDLGVALAVVRDTLDGSFSVLWVEGEDLYQRVVSFVRDFDVELAGRVRRSTEEVPLFERFGVEEVIEAALRPRVWLRSGGYLVIQPTEALVSIDVNTGRNVGRRSLAETIRQTNLEAVDETARQIRLRNLSGILVLDLIDMENLEHRAEVYAALEAALARDRVRTQVLSISEFGLVEMTRKRSRPSLHRWLTQECRTCRGQGRVHSAGYVISRLRAAVLQYRAHPSRLELRLRLHPRVAQALREEHPLVLEEMRQVVRPCLTLVEDPLLHEERFEIEEG